MIDGVVDVHTYSYPTRSRRFCPLFDSTILKISGSDIYLHARVYFPFEFLLRTVLCNDSSQVLRNGVTALPFESHGRRNIPVTKVVDCIV
jgi:hypothetical protein